jgi:hypothetical protein
MAASPHDPLIVIPVKDEAAAQALAAKVGELTPLQSKTQGARVLAGEARSLAALDKIQASARPELDKALAALGDSAVQAVFLPPATFRRAMLEALPHLPKELGNISTRVLDRGVVWAAAGVALAPKLSFRVVIQSRDAEAAQDLQNLVEKVFQALGREARDVPDFPKLLELVTPKAKGDRLLLNVGKEAYTKLMAPAVFKVRQAAQRTQSVNNLKQLALAMHNYHDTHKSFPTAANYGKDGKALLSWRVHILPYVEAGALYQEFHLDEPWDSPHNKKLIARMPAVYRSPQQKNADLHKTAYLVVTGKDAIFSGKKGSQIRDITDGTTNTIMIVEAADDQAVTWTKPADFSMDSKDPLKKLVRPGAQGFNAAFADGAVRFISAAIELSTLRAMFTRSGGEVIPQ